MRSAGRHHTLVPVIISITFLVGLCWSLRQAWTRTESDFPSYYTAAHLVLQRQPLREFYDMARFQQQLDLLVVPARLGGYIPQTPLTMLPFVPLAGFAIERAKQFWLIADIGFLSGTVLLLTRLTHLGVSGVLGLLLAGIGSLYTNLVLGQYYLLVLFLLTLAIYLLEKSREFSAGFVLGLICSLKLITAPFLLYFSWRKQPRALAGMCTALVFSVLLAIILFGWADLAYYLGQILPRSMAGETLDPFNPANGTFTTLLRRFLTSEPELNPNSPLNLPALLFYLRTLFTLSILLIWMFTFGRSRSTRQSYAGFLIPLILISPNTASYTFVLLLLPIALLLECAAARDKALLLLCYLLLAIPMRPSWNWTFPKVWLLGGMFFVALLALKQQSLLRVTVASTVLSAAFSFAITGVALFSSGKHTRRRWERIAVEPGSIYSSSPVPIDGGIIYQSISNGRYTLRLRRGQAVQTFNIQGDAFDPTFLPPRGLIRFESVSFGKSRSNVLDPETGTVRPSSAAHPGAGSAYAASPDGRWITYEERSSTSTQIYLVDQARRGNPVQVTEGNCNSFAPAWERDSRAIVFASDCGRGVGMPALYRAPLCDIKALPAR